MFSFIEQLPTKARLNTDNIPQHVPWDKPDGVNHLDHDKKQVPKKKHDGSPVELYSPPVRHLSLPKCEPPTLKETANNVVECHDSTCVAGSSILTKNIPDLGQREDLFNETTLNEASSNAPATTTDTTQEEYHREAAASTDMYMYAGSSDLKRVATFPSIPYCSTTDYPSPPFNNTATQFNHASSSVLPSTHSTFSYSQDPHMCYPHPAAAICMGSKKQQQLKENRSSVASIKPSPALSKRQQEKSPLRKKTLQKIKQPLVPSTPRPDNTTAPKVPSPLRFSGGIEFKQYKPQLTPISEDEDTSSSSSDASLRAVYSLPPHRVSFKQKLKQKGRETLCKIATAFRDPSSLSVGKKQSITEQKTASRNDRYRHKKGVSSVKKWWKKLKLQFLHV